MSNDELLQAILSKLEKVKGPDRQGWYTALCPYHDDRVHPNLRISSKGGFKCMTCGKKGSLRDLAEKLGIEVPRSAAAAKGTKRKKAGGATPVLTLAAYASAKGLSAAFLRNLGIGESRGHLEIPYCDEAGQVVAVRRRHSLTGDFRFSWRARDKPVPYGLSRLPQARQQGYIVLVEGESDAQTLWQCDIPSLGMPGANAWKSEWKSYIEGIARVYAVQEPDQGGQTFIHAIGETLGNRLQVVVTEGTKDVSELYLLDRAGFVEKFKGALSKARAYEPSDETEVPLLLHPTLEVRPELAVVGYRRQVVRDGKPGEEGWQFIAISKGIGLYKGLSVELPQGKAVFTKGLDAMPRADDQINPGELKRWLPAPDMPDPGNLYGKIKETIRRFVYLKEPCYGLLSAWVMGTYFHRAFGAYPFLHILGPKETGKTNTLCVLSKLTFNSFRASSITPAGLADTTDALRGTLLLDQANDLKENRDLLSLLADSYKREGGRRRLIEITRDGRRMLEFDSYSPKAFASTEILPGDLADRCFTIHMAPARGNRPDPSASKMDWRALRTDLVKLLLSGHSTVCELADRVNKEESRFGELWEPIDVMLTLARVDDQEKQSILLFCKEKFAQVRYELDDWDLALCEVVSEIEGEISASELLTKLRGYLDLEEGSAGPTSWWLGKALGTLGLIKTKDRRQRDGKQQRFYEINAAHASELINKGCAHKGSPKQTEQTATRQASFENGLPSGQSLPFETATENDSATRGQIHPEPDVAVSPFVPFPQRPLVCVHAPASKADVKLGEKAQQLRTIDTTSCKPSDPCHVCGSNKWWQRQDGESVCGRCHPNPNPDPAVSPEDLQPSDAPWLTEEHRREMIELWESLGKPKIPLRQGETITNLELFLSHKPARDEDLDIVMVFLIGQEAKQRPGEEVDHGHRSHTP